MRERERERERRERVRRRESGRGITQRWRKIRKEGKREKALKRGGRKEGEIDR